MWSCWSEFQLSQGKGKLRAFELLFVQKSWWFGDKLLFQREMTMKVPQALLIQISISIYSLVRVDYNAVWFRLSRHESCCNCEFLWMAGRITYWMDIFRYLSLLYHAEDIFKGLAYIWPPSLIQHLQGTRCGSWWWQRSGSRSVGIVQNSELYTVQKCKDFK